MSIPGKKRFFQKNEMISVLSKNAKGWGFVEIYEGMSKAVAKFFRLVLLAILIILSIYFLSKRCQSYRKSFTGPLFTPRYKNGMNASDDTSGLISVGLDVLHRIFPCFGNLFSTDVFFIIVFLLLAILLTVFGLIMFIDF